MASIDTVPEIGYAFLKTYYQRMYQDPTKLHHLYSTTAECTHVNYQNEWDMNEEQLPTIKLIGKENISKFYTRHTKKVRSIQVKVDGCDFQSAGANSSSILILAVGEMCWSETPAFRFCQTFLLTPVPSNPKIYDLTNDILRFIPQPLLQIESSFSEELKEHNSEYAAESTPAPQEPKKEELNAPPVENGSKVQAAEKSVQRVSEKPLKSSKREENTAKPELVSDEPVAAKSSSKGVREGETAGEPDATHSANGKSKSSSQPGTEKSEIDLKEAEASTSNETTNDEGVEPEKPITPEPAKKMNWASKLAASESKDVPNITTKYIRAEPETAQPIKKASERKSVSPGGAPRDGKDGKNLKKKQFYFVNKDGYYPVYVKGTGGVTDDQLVRALESEFGVVKKISSQETFAVVDFEDQRCQTDAIEKGTLEVNNVEVHMEPKTVRKLNSPSSAASSSTPSVGQRYSKKHTNKRKV
ncbi:LAFA_0F12640g1_1 [Lachancea sp. 'fantastica']|nr:LAFA_0F12640g1_1 [Lachancea sp. 'fantastica']